MVNEAEAAKSLLSALLAWLRVNAPGVLEEINPPASDAQIAAVENSAGIQLPEAFRQTLRTFNGQRMIGGAVFSDGQEVLSTGDLIQQWRINADLAVAGREAYGGLKVVAQFVKEGRLLLSGPVKPFPCSERWIPISTSNGDVNRYLDFDPPPGGTNGQVIEVDPEGCTNCVLAGSYLDYLRDYVQALQRGDYAVSEHGQIELKQDKPPRWEIPDYIKNL